MIHTNRIVTVGEQESVIDRPIVLYRGDREVEIEFTLVGNEFMFSTEGNVIKSTNASHGQLVLNTPSGENMFSALAECHDGKVVFVVTKEMIDELIETGFYSFQVRLYDSEEMRSRVTIPPVMNGFDIRNPIAAEDETNVVDVGLVDYSRIVKDQSNEEIPTFTWDGEYVKTEWVHHDVITANKMNKIEDALYSINANIKESDVVMLNALDNVKKDADAYVKEHMAEVEADVEEFERNLNTGVEQFKIDTNTAMTAHKNEVSEVVDGFSGEIESINSQLDHKANKSDLNLASSNISILENNKADKTHIWSMSNMGQDIKEAMAGGSVAVVGKNAILEENIVDLQVTRSKVANGVMDIYPFQPRAKFRHNKNTTPDSDFESDIRGLIKDIKLYNADNTKQYYIQAINRNVNYNYYIAICDSDNVIVCEFNINSYNERGGLDTIKLISTNNSGVSGIVVVDWSKFRQNTGIYGMDYEETGLQIGVIADNDGANLKDYSIPKEKLSDNSLMTYPFQPRANFKHDGNQYRDSIRQSVKDIHLYGAKPNKKYAISTLWRSVAVEKKYIIEIVEVSDNNVITVASTEIWGYQEPNGIDEFTLTTRNDSGIDAIVYIDWTKIPLGDGYYNMRYNETGIDIRCCKDKRVVQESPNIILPQKIYATVGKELNIYYESVVDCDNVFDYKVDVEYNGQDAKQLEECFRVIPTTAGNYTFTLKLYRYGDLITSKTCTICVVADKTLGDIRGLYIGDSITQANWYLHELQNMISTFKSVGTMGDWGGLNHEGRGSWATTHYLSSTSYAGKTNAFYNPSSNSFDFNYYISNSSIEIPSFVTLALGTNDAGNINADTLVANFNTMINSIRRYDSNMKIGITIAPLPASNQDGWGKCNGVSKNNWTHKKEIFEFAKKIIEVFDNREDEGIYILPIYVNIDPLLDFPYEEVEASFRNKTIIKRGTDNVHPNKEGMYKISDIHYNWIKAIF